MEVLFLKHFCGLNKICDFSLKKRVFGSFWIFYISTTKFLFIKRAANLVISTGAFSRFFLIKCVSAEIKKITGNNENRKCFDIIEIIGSIKGRFPTEICKYVFGIAYSITSYTVVECGCFQHFDPGIIWNGTLKLHKIILKKLAF